MSKMELPGTDSMWTLTRLAYFIYKLFTISWPVVRIKKAVYAHLFCLVLVISIIFIWDGRKLRLPYLYLQRKIWNRPRESKWAMFNGCMCVLASNEVDRQKWSYLIQKTDFSLDKPESTEPPQCCRNRPVLILGSKALTGEFQSVYWGTDFSTHESWLRIAH